MSASNTMRRWLRIVLLLAFTGGALVGYRAAVRTLRGHVLGALGPDAEIASVGLGWSGVTLEGLRIKATGGWPAGDALRAQRVVIAPSLASLFSTQVKIRSVTVYEPYVSAFRTHEGKLEVLPSLLGSGESGAELEASTATGHEEEPERAAMIRSVRIEGGVFELFDGSVQTPPYTLRLEDVDATVRDVLVPQLAGHTEVELTGTLKGVDRDGHVSVSGWADVAAEECAIVTSVRGADLKTLQPYLIKKGEGGIRRGTLDLDLDSRVSDQQLRAPGRVTISDLELAPGHGATPTFMGVSGAALLAFMANENGQITVTFVVEGDINNPHFSLRNSLASLVASSVAQTLAATAGGVANTVGRSTVDAAKKAGSAAGTALKNLVDGLRSH